MIDLGTMLGKLQKIEKKGDRHMALCPAHADKNPSLSVKLGDRGGILVKCYAGCDLSAITAAIGIKVSDLMPADDNGRKLEPEVVTTYNYADASGQIVARKQRLRDETGVKSFRWQRPDPKNPGRWIPGGNTEPPLYRLPELIGARADELVVIVEGEKDADALASLGFVVTTTANGASEKWRESDSQFFAGRRVAVIADDDEPGRKKAKATADALKGIAAAVGVVTLPNAAQIKGFDASDYLASGGTVEKLRNILEHFDVAPLPAEVATVEVIEERLLELWRRGGAEPGVFSGWRALDSLFRPKVGQLAVITGSPNAGKSTWLDDLVIRTSCADDGPTLTEKCARWRWVLFSAEQYPAERHVSMLLQKLTAKPFMLGRTARMSEGEVLAAYRVLRDHVTLLDPRFSSLTIDRILEIASDLNAREKRHALLIDPFNVLAATSRSKAESEHDFINSFLTKLRTFAQAEQMAVFVVAHPTKLRRAEGEDEYPVVRPWDISGSAHWFNHADHVISVWRAMKDADRIARGEVEIHVQKVRFQPECGTLGMARLFFDRVSTKYLEAANAEDFKPAEVPYRPRTARASRNLFDARMAAAEGNS